MQYIHVYVQTSQIDTQKNRNLITKDLAGMIRKSRSSADPANTNVRSATVQWQVSRQKFFSRFEYIVYTAAAVLLQMCN